MRQAVKINKSMKSVSMGNVSMSEKSIPIKQNALINKLKADSFAVREPVDEDNDVIVK